MAETALALPSAPSRTGRAALALGGDPDAVAVARSALLSCGMDVVGDESGVEGSAPDTCCVVLAGNDAFGAAGPAQRLPRERILGAARSMARRGAGRMVLVADSGPQVHTAGSADSAGARAADLAWWRHLAGSVAAHGVTANTVAVGYAPFLGHGLPARVEAELLRHLAIRRPAEPADLSGAVSFLTSPGCSYLVGESIPLDGGMDLDFIPTPWTAPAASADGPPTPPPGPTEPERPVVLIVGASSGIGRAAALHLARQGADVVLAARRRGELEAVAAQVAAAGHKAWVLPCDAADGDAVAGLVDLAWKAAGRVDRLLYAAGHLEFGAARTGIDAWQRTLAVNLGGYTTVSDALVRRWIDAGTAGVIAAVASVGSTSVPVTRVEAYGASKAAMVQYSRCLAASTARYGIRVNCVCPGIIETPMGEAAGPGFRDGWLRRIPAGRVGGPAEVAAVLGYLLSPAARYVTGARMRVDGGYGLGGLPPLTARLCAAAAEEPVYSGKPAPTDVSGGPR